MRKANILRYYYYGYILCCNLPFVSFKEAVKIAYNVHLKQCKAYNLIVDSRSKDYITNELKKIYGLCDYCY